MIDKITINCLDPFAVKRHPKWHPYRFLYTLWARRNELTARQRFNNCTIPGLTLGDLPAVPEVDWQHTEVRPEQLAHLLAGIRATESLTGCCVEVGAYRGETAAALAAATSRPYFLVDPYIGYGGSTSDLEQMQRRTKGLSNVTHLLQSSGQAAATWTNGAVSFVFIDAVHDYVNARFDFAAWSRLVVLGGIVAFHDTDNPAFAGVRRAVHEIAPPWELFAHVPDLVMLIKR